MQRRGSGGTFFGLLLIVGAIVVALALTNPSTVESLKATDFGKQITQIAGGLLPGASGDQATASKILAEARTFDAEPYRITGGHDQSYQKGTGIDCSGLVVRSVLNATGIYDNHLADDFVNSPHWARIAVAQAREGDLVVRLKAARNLPDDHIAFVVKNEGGGKLTVFEAWSGQVALADQIRETPGSPATDWDYALRWKG